MKRLYALFIVMYLCSFTLYAQDERKIIVIDDETDVKTPKKKNTGFQGVAKINMSRFFRGELPVGIEFAPFKNSEVLTFDIAVGPTFRDMMLFGEYDFVTDATKLPYKDVKEESANYKVGAGINLGMRLYPSADDFFDGGFLALNANFRTHSFDANYNLDNNGDRTAVGSFKRNVREFSLCYGYQSEYDNFYWESYFGIGVRIYSSQDIQIVPDDPNSPLTLYHAEKYVNRLQAPSIFWGIKLGWGFGN